MRVKYGIPLLFVGNTIKVKFVTFAFLISIALLTLGVNAQENGFTFTEITIVAGDSEMRSVNAADINGDGQLNVIAGGRGIRWFEDGGSGNYTGTRIAEETFAALHDSPFDVDGDGDIDIAGAERGRPYDVAWYENDGNGNFTKRPIAATQTDSAIYLDVDLDDDGDQDIVSSTHTDRRIHLRMNDGSGNFTDHAYFYGLNFLPSRIDAGEMDENPGKDLIIADYPDRLVMLITNGSNRPAFRTLSTSWDPYNAVVVDMDQDEHPDILGTTDSGNNLVVMLNDGQGAFNPLTLGYLAPWPANYAGYAKFLAPGDVDSDGDLDIFLIENHTNRLLLLQNQGKFNFTCQPIGNVTDIQDYHVVDLDQNGLLDLLLASPTTGSVTWWRQEASDQSADGGCENWQSSRPDATTVFFEDFNDGDRFNQP